nr:hypothetical protein [Tanacetum cinerariifolium]
MTKRKDTEVPQLSVPTSVADEAVNEEMDNSLKRVATTATSLDAEQNRGDAAAQTKFKRVSKVGLSIRVESFKDKGLGKKDASKQGRIVDIDANKNITLVSTHDEQMFNADKDLGGEEVCRLLLFYIIITYVDSKQKSKKEEDVKRFSSERKLWLHISSGSGNQLHWQWEVVMAVETL